MYMFCSFSRFFTSFCILMSSLSNRIIRSRIGRNARTKELCTGNYRDDRFHLGVIESKIKEGRGREAQNIDEVQR
jgi:hypothetical protein